MLLFRLFYILIIYKINLTLGQANGYQYWCTGNCNNNVSPVPHSGIILMGGSTDVDDAISQQIKWSNCGDFLVLRVSGLDGYNNYIYNLGCSNSVKTILITSKAGSNNQFVIDTIDNSEAIFFAGGDQSVYLSRFIGTELQNAVQRAINRNVPIGGTSAGEVIQSFYIYSAEHGSVSSTSALNNPYNKDMTFSNYFILQISNLLNNTILDSHFEERDRFGRLLTFVARIITDDNYGINRPIKGIGINEETAIIIDGETGLGRITGYGNYCDAWIIIPDNIPQVCKNNEPLTYENVQIILLQGRYGDIFDFYNWDGGYPGNYYKISAVDGKLTTNPYNPINRFNNTRS